MSLTVLKLSISITMQASGVPPRRAAAQSCASRSIKIPAIGQARQDVGQGILFEATMGNGQLGVDSLNLLPVEIHLVLQRDNSQAGSDAGEQRSGRERFCDEIVDAGFEEPDQVSSSSGGVIMMM